MARAGFIVLFLLTGIAVCFWGLEDPGAAGTNAAGSGDREIPQVSADVEAAQAVAPLPDARSLTGSISIPKIPFVDFTAASGITFHHERGLSGERLLPETMGSGCAVLDINSDDLPDVVFVNSQQWDWVERSEGHTPATLSAWQNLGGLRFREVTAEVGLDVSLFGMGCATGDYDNDGDTDLYVTAVGKNILFRNDAGRFVDVSVETATAGTEKAWSTSATWLDYDLDGNLDLFVGNYVGWDREIEQVIDAITSSGDPRFGSPDAYPGASPFLFRNNGNGTFEDVAADVGFVPKAKTLGVSVLDSNEDGRPDLFVANDGVPDQLWISQPDYSFVDVAVSAGVAVSNSGAPRAGMGVDTGFFRTDGSHAIVIGHYENEMSALFVSGTAGLYTDQSLATGFGRDSLPDLTWGIRFVDLDLDGRQEIVAVNGHTEESDDHMFHPDSYRQSVSISWNAGANSPREFVPLNAEFCGEDIFLPVPGRSMAAADFDGDGDTDLIVSSSGDAVRFFANRQALGNNWIRVRLVGTHSSRSAIGATVSVTADGVTQKQFVSPTRGYLSSGSADLTFGIGDAARVDRMEVKWPGGKTQVTKPEVVNQLFEVEQLAEDDSINQSPRKEGV